MRPTSARAWTVLPSGLAIVLAVSCALLLISLAGAWSVGRWGVAGVFALVLAAAVLFFTLYGALLSSSAAAALSRSLLVTRLLPLTVGAFPLLLGAAPSDDGSAHWSQATTSPGAFAALTAAGVAVAALPRKLIALSVFGTCVLAVIGCILAFGILGD